MFESKEGSMRSIVCNALFILFVLSSSNCKAQVQNGEEPIRDPVELHEFKVSVVDAAGNPIEGAEVLVGGVRCQEDPGSWYAWPAANGGPMPIVPTDEQGVARFKYPTKVGSAGKYFTITTLTMTFRHASYISERAEANVDAEAFEQVLNPGCRVTYSAVDDSGEAIEEFGACISGPGFNAKWTRTDGTIQSMAVPDGAWQTMLVAPRTDGITLFSGILPARYRSGREVTIRNVTLRPGLRVRGRLAEVVPRPISDGVVIAWSQPRPAKEAIEKQEAIGWSDSTVIRADGTFEFASLPPDGRLQLIAVCRGWVIADQPRFGQPGGQIKAGILIDLESADIPDNVLEDVELPMEEAGAIEVTVKHLDGRPAAGIRVGASPNQKLEDHGTQLLGEAYPSIVWIRSQIDGTEPPNYWQLERKTRYLQETDAEGKAVLYDLPLGSWGVFVGNDRFKLVTENEQPNRLYTEISVDVSQAETVSATAIVEPIGD